MLFPGEDHFSTPSFQLPLVLCAGLRPHVIFPFPFGMPIDVVHFEFIRQLYWWNFTSVASDTSRRYKVTANSLIPCLLEPFYPHFCHAIGALGVEVIWEMHPMEWISTTLRFDLLWFSVVVPIYCKVVYDPIVKRSFLNEGWRLHSTSVYSFLSEIMLVW